MVVLGRIIAADTALSGTTMMNNDESENLKQKHASEIESLKNLCIDFKRDAEKEKARVENILETIFIFIWGLGPFLFGHFGFNIYISGFASLFLALAVTWILKKITTN
jgi:hypothetical protein